MEQGKLPFAGQESSSETFRPSNTTCISTQLMPNMPLAGQPNESNIMTDDQLVKFIKSGHKEVQGKIDAEILKLEKSLK